MAIEDALVLATLLAEHWEKPDGHVEAFYLYEVSQVCLLLSSGVFYSGGGSGTVPQRFEDRSVASGTTHAGKLHCSIVLLLSKC